MDFELTTQEKINTLTGLKKSMKNEIYNVLLRVGLDPDTFDRNDFSGFPELMVGEKERIQTLFSGLDMIEAKLAVLQ